MNKKKSQTIELLNFEGPVLRAVKEEDGMFAILDQWSKEVDWLSLTNLIKFLDGEHEIVDSSGKSWNYLGNGKGGQTPRKEILAFVGVPTYSIDREELYSKYMEWVDQVCEECDWKTEFGPKEIVHAIVSILESNQNLIKTSR